jgi:hypothetical protein
MDERKDGSAALLEYARHRVRDNVQAFWLYQIEVLLNRLSQSLVKY